MVMKQLQTLKRKSPRFIFKYSTQSEVRSIQEDPTPEKSVAMRLRYSLAQADNLVVNVLTARKAKVQFRAKLQTAT